MSHLGATREPQYLPNFNLFLHIDIPNRRLLKKRRLITNSVRHVASFKNPGGGAAEFFLPPKQYPSMFKPKSPNILQTYIFKWFHFFICVAIFKKNSCLATLFFPKILWRFPLLFKWRSRKNKNKLKDFAYFTQKISKWNFHQMVSRIFCYNESTIFFEKLSSFICCL